MLALAISLWAELGLAAPSPDRRSMECQHRSALESESATSARGQVSSPVACPEEHASSMPCCPSQSEPLSRHATDRSCCMMSDEPARPLVFLLVSDSSLDKQLIPDGLLTGIPPLRLSQPIFASWHADVPLYVQPISQRKTDLRI